MKKKNPDILPF